MTEKPIAAVIEKIAKECQEANAGKWTITKIVKQLSSQETQDSKELRKQALEMLQQLDPKAASVYASFQRMQVRTSSQLIENFDRGNIIKSLLRETSVPRGVAEKIGGEVEEKIKDLEIESISTALIREMVNVKLLEYGHENIRSQYTRVGLPVFEAEKKAGQKPFRSKAIMEEYHLLRVIPKKLGRMHLGNELFIAEIQDFSTRPTAINLTAEVGETPKETVFSTLEKANKMERFFSWRPNISSLNLAVATNTGKKAAKDAGMLFARASKAVFLSGKSIPSFNTMHLFETDLFAGKGIEKEGMVASANEMIKASLKEPFPAFESAVAIDSKYKLKLLHNHMPKTILNCRNKELSLVNGIAFEGEGLASFTALNLVLIALKCKGNEAKFFEELREKAGAISRLDQLKRKKLSERDYIKKQGINMEKLSSCLALDSLIGAGKALLETEKESETLQFGEKILSELLKELPENFALAELRNKKALHRFSLENRKNFGGKTEAVKEGLLLGKSRQICKNYCFAAKAENKKELNELIESNVKLIKIEEKE